MKVKDIIELMSGETNITIIKRIGTDDSEPVYQNKAVKLSGELREAEVVWIKVYNQELVLEVK